MPLSPSLMASIPQLSQFYSNYTFPTTDLTELPTPGMAEINGNTSLMDNTMWGQDNNYFIPVHDHFVLQDWDTMSSAWMPSISDCKMGFCGSIESFQNFSCGYQLPHVGEFEEDFKPPKTTTENWVCLMLNSCFLIVIGTVHGMYYALHFSFLKYFFNTYKLEYVSLKYAYSLGSRKPKSYALEFLHHV